MSTVTLPRPAPGTAHRQPARGWFARWVERVRREREARLLRRAADTLLRRAAERRPADSSYAADLETAALAALEMSLTELTQSAARSCLARDRFR